MLLMAAVVTLVVVAAVSAVLVVRARAASDSPAASATLHSADGRSVGRVDFYAAGTGLRARVSVQMPSGTAAFGAYHGLHIHANNDATNGNDCAADPAEPPARWFASADGHYDKRAAHNHAAHDGDLASLYLSADGRGIAEFRTDRLSPADLASRVVILHAGPDNFGNVPVGTAPAEYTANSPAAKEATERTGNAGDRVACGVITLRR
jgi:superoxide dismutase, Cu-Zn family